MLESRGKEGPPAGIEGYGEKERAVKEGHRKEGEKKREREREIDEERGGNRRGRRSCGVTGEKVRRKEEKKGGR